MRLERLTGLETEKENEIAELRKFINECNEVLRSHERKLQIIVKELLEIKKQYGDGRRSEISLSDDLDIEDEDLILSRTSS